MEADTTPRLRPGAPRPSRAIKTALTAAAAAGLLATVWLGALLVRAEVPVTGVLAAFSATVGALNLERLSRRDSLALAAAACTLGSTCVWLFTQWYPAFAAAQIAATVSGLAFLSRVWLTWAARPVGRGRRSLRRIGGVVVIAPLGAISAICVCLAVSPTSIAASLQAVAGFRNSFQPAAAPAVRTVHGDIIVRSDVRYGTSYPNSYLDVYRKGTGTAHRPTVVYLHGGGWSLGSKSLGDPNAGGTEFALGNGPLIAAGYNLVSIDYALAPQVGYPTPLIQLGEAIHYLRQHSRPLGLDMTKIVLAGTSAGGNIVGQFAAIQTDAGYARAVGIAAVIDPSTLRAVVLDSAVIDPARAGQTEAPDTANDWLFTLAVRAYWRIPGFPDSGSPLLQQADLLLHVTRHYPPTFIADGNVGTFPDQAADLAQRLRQLGVRTGIDLHRLEEVRLGHAYMAFEDSAVTHDYNFAKICFLDAVTR